MSANGAKRHQRQRSSVTIKRRTSASKLGTNGFDADDVPDNALTTSVPRDATAADVQEPNATGTSDHAAPTSQGATGSQSHNRVDASGLSRGAYDHPTTDGEKDRDATSSGSSSTEQDYFSFRYVHSAPDTSIAEEDGEEEETTEHTYTAQEASPATQLPQTMHERLADDMTTRTEIDLFGEDDSSENVFLDRSHPTPLTAASMNTLQATREGEDEVTKPKPLSSEASATTPKQADIGRGSQDAFTRPSSVKGPRRLSLLNGGGVLSTPSPSTSPRVSRVQNSSFITGSPISSSSPSAILSNNAMTPRSARKTNRMSLGYVATPDGTARGAQALNSPSAGYAGTSYVTPLSAWSSGSVNDQKITRMSARSASVSTNASHDSSAGQASTDEGETMLTQHKGILERIAEKERAIFELKEILSREEKELKELRREWQKTVTLEMVAEKKSTGLNGGKAAANEDGVEASRQSAASPTAGASGALKGFSAKFQNGFGSQINAFLDQLVALPENEGRPHQQKQPQSHLEMGQSTSLESLSEEAEDNDKLGKMKSLPAVPMAKHSPTTSTRPLSADIKPVDEKQKQKPQHIKRTSMFGASFAALQKQVESQFGVSGGADGDTLSQRGNGEADARQSTADSGWGAWQKKLREARESASGILAMAEAKLGQAMALEELEEANLPPPRRRDAPTTAFTTENDREKAALAELNWLNSLAGIKTSGTVDRVITSNSPQVNDGQASFNGQSSMSSSARLSQSNLLQLDQGNKIARATSPSSSSQSTTRAGQAQSPILSGNIPISKQRRTSQSKESEKRAPNGLFDVLSAVWSPTDNKSPPSSIKAVSPVLNKDRRLSGQSRTRLAVIAAVSDNAETGATATEPVNTSPARKVPETETSPASISKIKEGARDGDLTSTTNGIGLFVNGQESRSSSDIGKTQPATSEVHDDSATR